MKKLREEHENLSDLIFEDYRSSSESINSNDALQENRNRWHSAEDVRSRKQRSSIKRDSHSSAKHGNHNNQRTSINNNDSLYEFNETAKGKNCIDADIDQIVVENKHFRMVILFGFYFCSFFKKILCILKAFCILKLCLQLISISYTHYPSKVTNNAIKCPQRQNANDESTKNHDHGRHATRFTNLDIGSRCQF